MIYKKLPIFYFLIVAFSRLLTLKSLPGLLCLFVNSSKILATNLENNRIEKEPLTTETAAENCFEETKEILKTKVHRKRLTQKLYVEYLKYMLGFFIVLILFIN
ncbi:hypothetical protein NBO_4g0062 [Nosema bombycis CQ1]|uniref:Uncharacterized protein n=1 Tax=Nosema bombycis (strain CQ1 / CVCC 102059) TaxID=578461 RepID=R0MBW2_NOSB1|nr:hypothetical protein NBO_4g0062 [Nosema bombycis CQ1]|eukprot:EOB15434.1 hypothetical protein NBO_4g0062 [Nosema bombycis CQ1]